MDEFSPLQGYNPEDEYAPLDAEPNAQSAPEIPEAPQPQPTAPEQPIPEPPVYDGAQESIPQYRPYQQPYPGYPAQQSYPQPPYPQQPVTPPVQPPYQPPYRPQQPPQGYGMPYRQQPMQQPMPTQRPYPAPARPMQPTQQVQNVQLVQPPYPQAQIPQPDKAYAQNPYSTAPYQQPMPIQQKPVTPTGTKVFIIILCALLLAMVGGFIAYVAITAGNNNNNNNTNNNSGFSFYGDDLDDDNGQGFNPFGGNSITSYTDVEDEITLKEDNGDTQKRDDDNEASVGEPDEDAAGITLQALPKDKDDEKYTTQSAYDSVCDSVVTVMCYEDEISDDEKDIQSQGTGTIISADGYLITNAHVIGNSRYYAVSVVLNNGDKYQAKIVGYDTWTDLAVLKIDAKDLKPVTFGDSALINIGDEVIAVGSPGGVKFQNSLTKGIVSAVDRELSINRYVRYIQSDAAISPGSSGGPLCNIYGQVIGITTAKTIATYYENMSFSIPSETVEEIVSDLIHYGYVKGRTRLGLTGTAVSEEEVYYYGVPAGIEINSIDENGPLGGSDLQPGDIITELDGQEIASFQDIYDVLADHEPGDKITITASRPKQ